MTQNQVDGPDVLQASRPVDEDTDEGDGTLVRETRPVGASDDTATSAPERYRSTGAIRAERRAKMLERYGGFYWGSDFIGFAVATFFTILFLGIVGAVVGAVGFQLHAPVPKLGQHLTGTSVNLGIGALIGSLVAVFLAYLLGGYTAARMARFDGARQGLGVVIWTVLVAVILGIVGAVAGSQFNVANQLHLNVDRGTLTAGGAVSLAVALVVMLVGAVLGGSLGVRFHRQVDADAEALE